jgi:hypothetical protein
VGQLKRAEDPYRFRIPDDLVPRLRELQARQKSWSDVVDAEDVVHLYYGLGPALFLAFDGRVITDDYDNFTEGAGVYEVTDPKEAWVAVAIGADVWGVPELRRLLPERPGARPTARSARGRGGCGRPRSTRGVASSAGSAGRWVGCRRRTPNQALQQTGAACRLSGIHSSPSGPGC